MAKAFLRHKRQTLQYSPGLQNTMNGAKNQLYASMLYHLQATHLCSIA